MSSLSNDAYVGTLHYKFLDPPVSGSSLDLLPITLDTVNNFVGINAPAPASALCVNGNGESGYAVCIEGVNFGQEGGIQVRDYIGEKMFLTRGDIAGGTGLVEIGDIDEVGSGLRMNVDINDALVKILSGTIQVPNMPTSAGGLASGTVWNNGGVLNIVP